MTINTRITALAQSISKQPSPACILIKTIDSRNGKSNVMLIPSTTIENRKEFKTILLENGHPISTVNVDLNEFYNSLETTFEHKIITTNIPGWVDNDYINNKGDVFTSKDIYKPRLHPNTKVAQFDQSKQGSLKEWQDNVSIFAIYSSRLMLGLCSALSGTIIKFTDVENGGFHIHGDSSMGKSSSIKFAASIRCSKDGICNWNITPAALEETAMAHNDSTLLLDELRLLDDNINNAAKKASSYIYMITEGKGKSRSSYYQQTELTWRLTFLSAGELSLSEHAYAGGTYRMNGECVRAIDIPADAGAGMGIYESLPEGINSANELAKRITTNTSKYYGTALPAFIEKLSKFIQKHGESRLRNKISNHIKYFITKVKIDDNGQHFRIASKFALLYAAGCLSVKSKIVPLTEDNILDGILKCYHDAMSSIPTSTNQKLSNFKRSLRQEIVSSNVTNLMKSTMCASDLNDLPIVIGIIGREKIIGIQKQHFDSMFDSTNEIKRALMILDNENLLFRDAQKNPTRQLTLKNKEHLKRRYCLKYNVFNDNY